MLLYERFTVPDSADAARPIPGKDAVTGGNLVLFRTAMPSAEMATRLGEASRVYESWAARHYARQATTELFTTPGTMWLVASSEVGVADLLAEMRGHGLFETPRVQAPPPPRPLPPPQPKGCAGCGKTPLPGKAVCAACATKTKAPPRPRPRWKLLAWALAVGLAGTLLLWWLATRGNDGPPGPKAAPIVQFTARPTRVKRGGTVVLKWQTSGLNSLWLAPGVGSVSASGSRSVVVNQDTTFTLRSADRDAPPPATLTVKVMRASASPVHSNAP